MVTISQGSLNRQDRTAAIGMSVALPLAAATLEAATGSRAATVHAASAKCHVVVTAAPWSIRSRVGRLSGNRYTLVADSPWCSAGRAWVVKFTHQKSKRLGQALTGPRGLKCHSLATRQAVTTSSIPASVGTRQATSRPALDGRPKSNTTLTDAGRLRLAETRGPGFLPLATDRLHMHSRSRRRGCGGRIGRPGEA